MIVAVSAGSGSVRPACAEAPLTVQGTVHGHHVEALVTGLPDVVAQISRWVWDDPDAVGCWGLRTDYSESVLIPVRRKVGSVRESRRAAHVVRLLPGESHGSELVAMCGERLSLLGVDVLPLGVGMPCERCLAGYVGGVVTAGRGSSAVALPGVPECPAEDALAARERPIVLFDAKLDRQIG
jgi:hypothetical protein